jgi:hypothetical protein
MLVSKEHRDFLRKYLSRSPEVNFSNPRIGARTGIALLNDLDEKDVQLQILAEQLSHRAAPCALTDYGDDGCDKFIQDAFGDFRVSCCAKGYSADCWIRYSEWRVKKNMENDHAG